MRMDKSKVIKAIKKTTAVTTAAILVNAMTLISLDTYSWFESRAESSAYVRAAATSDILDSIIVVDAKGNSFNYADENNNNIVHNPEYFDITGKMEGAYTIYFEVRDDIQNFVLHINPIVVRTGVAERANINISLSPEQYNELLKLKAQEIVSSLNLSEPSKPGGPGDIKCDANEVVFSGAIYVKYLNSYIERRIPVSFCKEYLMAKDKETIDYVTDKEVEIATLQAELETLQASKDLLDSELAKQIEESGNKDSAIMKLKEEMSALSLELENAQKSADDAASDGTTALEGTIDGNIDAIVKEEDPSKVVEPNPNTDATANGNDKDPATSPAVPAPVTPETLPIEPVKNP